MWFASEWLTTTRNDGGSHLILMRGNAEQGEACTLLMQDVFTLQWVLYTPTLCWHSIFSFQSPGHSVVHGMWLEKWPLVDSTTHQHRRPEHSNRPKLP